MKNKYYVGVDVGGTKIVAGLVTAGGKILTREKTPTPTNAPAKKIVQILQSVIENVVHAEGLRIKDISAIGMGVPGLVSPDGRITRTPNMNLSGFNLARELKSKLKVKIAIGNDVNVGLLGEKWMGAARKTKNVVSLFVGTGLGAAAIVDDKLMLGAHGAACEIGHMTIVKGGHLCSCGNQGCLEAYVGRWAIERDIRESIKAGQKSVVTRMIDGEVKSIKSKVLLKALAQKDHLITRVIKDVSQTLGMAAVSVRHIFDPEMIIFGGGVIEACGDFILPMIRKAILTDKLFVGLKNCQVVSSELGDDAIILGGVDLAQR